MGNKRPTLNDPEEYALIKSIHFKDNKPFNDDLDPAERISRQEANYKHRNKSAR